MNAPLILSLFPGIDMLGSGFERAGFTVLRGPDKITGGDIRAFHAPRSVFLGVVGGSPCQDFSDMRRSVPTGEGMELLDHFARCVEEAAPEWFLLENVRKVPAITVPGYTVQRLPVRASEFGAKQHRQRIFQFGYRDGLPLILRRPAAFDCPRKDHPHNFQPAALATEGNRGMKRRGWDAFCALQGFDTPPDLDSFTKAGKYRAVGNGVHRAVAHAIAVAILSRAVTQGIPCACGCGRPVKGQRYAITACRKRAQRTRDASWKVTAAGKATRVPRDGTSSGHLRTDTPGPNIH
jgi:DNA (cytosine-5)-methyltransferase 1